MDPRQLVGATVKRARGRAGLSLAQLAARSGVSKSALHEIEQSNANPRLDTLYAIANALGLGLANLLESDGERPEVTRADDGPVLDGDAVQARLHHRIGDAGQVEVYTTIIGPDLQRSDAHVPGTTECLIVNHGRVEVGAEGDPQVLGSGDSVWFDADRPHTYRSLGATTAHATLLVIHP